MKPKILYYSDCDFFAGCENMLANFSAAPRLRQNYQFVMAYRRNPVYQQGLNLRTQFLAQERLPQTRYRETIPTTARGWLRGLIKLAQIVGRPVFFWADVWLSWRLVRQQRPQIVHINNGGFPAALSANAMAVGAWLAGCRSIVYVVNNLAESYRPPARWLDWVHDRLTGLCVRQFITGSLAAKRQLERVLGLPSSRVVNLPNGIRPRNAQNSREQTRRTWGVAAQTVVIASVALLIPRKGHRFLIEALARVRQQAPELGPWHLLIEGEGSERSALEQQVRDLGLSAQVRFLGRANDLYGLYQAADLLVLSSVDSEDFPNVILEAMSQSLPVIATRIAGVPEQIVEGETGLLVPPRDSQALSQALVTLIANASRRQIFGQAARQRFERLFAADIAVDRYNRLYDSLARESWGGHH